MPVISRLAFIALCAHLALAQRSPDLWRGDLDFMVAEVQRIHPDPFTRIPRSEFEAAASDLRDRIGNMADHEVTVAFARLIASLGDAHTNVSLTQAAAALRQFPVRLRWFDDGLYVTHASPAYVRAIGRRVSHIAGVSAEEAFERTRPLISHENESWARELDATLLSSPEVLHALGVIPSLAAPLPLVLEEPAGDIQVTLGGAATLPHHLPRPGNPRYQLNAALNYWYDYLPDSRAVYLKYNRCKEAPGLAFLSLLNSLSELGQNNRIERFIIDLRNNTGGDTEIVRPLLAGLNEAFAAGAIQRSGVRVIIGRQTFSAAMRNAIDLKRLGAVLVGEPTGGRPNAFGNVQSVTLRNSGLIVSISSRQFVVPDVQTPSLTPDRRVAFTPADYFADRDPFLEAALVE